MESENENDVKNRGCRPFFLCLHFFLSIEKKKSYAYLYESSLIVSAEALAQVELIAGRLGRFGKSIKNGTVIIIHSD